MSYYNNNYELRLFTSIAPDTFQDSHFFQAIETISLSGTTWLPPTISAFFYGCDWDGCNIYSLPQYFPESFQMNISDAILNSELLNGQLPAQNCYSCSACINGLTGYSCLQQSCANGTCYIDELHNYVTTATNNCTFFFNSICQPFANTVQTPSIRIRATYYIDFPQEKQLEIDEVDITCTKDLCNSIEIVENLKGQIQTTININPDFRPNRVNDTTTTVETTTVETPVVETTTVGTPVVETTTVGTPVVETTTVETTTANGSKPARAYLIIFPYLILFMLLL